MKMPFKVAIAVLAGIGVGLAGHELQGEQAKAPPAFVISNIQVTNAEKYQKYAEAAAAVVTAYHGKIRSSVPMKLATRIWFLANSSPVR